MTAAVQDLALYVHWPYCARICPYCDFNVVRDRGRSDEQAALARALVADIEAQAKALGPRRLLSIFFGGGTPSLMSPAYVEDVLDAAVRLFTPADDLEVTLEANPTDAEAQRFADLAHAGVQRLSLGVQSLDDSALRFLGRNHGAEEARRALTLATELFPRVSLDLIYALPGQAPDAWAADLEAALSFGPEHVSPYQLTIEQTTAFGRAARRGSLTPLDEDPSADLFELTQSLLEARGFDAYEVSNHARGPAARSRHNLAVWRGVDYLGVGPGAHGRVTSGGVRIATRAATRIGDYLERVTTTGVGLDERQPLSARDANEERLMLSLRTSEGASPELLAALDLDPVTGRVASLVDVGLLQVRDGRLSATPQGRLVLDRLLYELLA